MINFLDSILERISENFGGNIMNNSIAVHSQTDLINIYNNECNNYSESVNNRQYNIDKRNSDNIFNIKHNILGHNNSDNRYCICNNILLKLIIPVIILAVITLRQIPDHI
jgi:hypothetical protein